MPSCSASRSSSPARCCSWAVRAGADAPRGRRRSRRRLLAGTWLVGVRASGPLLPRRPRDPDDRRPSVSTTGHRDRLRGGASRSRPPALGLIRGAARPARGMEAGPTTRRARLCRRAGRGLLATSSARCATCGWRCSTTTASSTRTEAPHVDLTAPGRRVRRRRGASVAASTALRVAPSVARHPPAGAVSRPSPTRRSAARGASSASRDTRPQRRGEAWRAGLEDAGPVTDDRWVDSSSPGALGRSPTRSPWSLARGRAAVRRVAPAARQRGRATQAAGWHVGPDLDEDAAGSAATSGPTSRVVAAHGSPTSSGRDRPAAWDWSPTRRGRPRAGAPGAGPPGACCRGDGLASQRRRSRRRRCASWPLPGCRNAEPAGRHAGGRAACLGCRRVARPLGRLGDGPARVLLGVGCAVRPVTRPTSARQRALRPRQDRPSGACRVLAGRMSLMSSLLVVAVVLIAVYVLAALIFPERF